MILQFLFGGRKERRRCCHIKFAKKSCASKSSGRCHPRKTHSTHSDEAICQEDRRALTHSFDNCRGGEVNSKKARMKSWKRILSLDGNMGVLIFCVSNKILALQVTGGELCHGGSTIDPRACGLVLLSGFCCRQEFCFLSSTLEIVCCS